MVRERLMSPIRILMSAAALLTLSAPAIADQPMVVAQAFKVVSALETETGMPIAVLERTGDHPGEFWYKAAQALCKKTGDNFCEEDVQVLTDTTNLLGWARVLAYKNDAGIEKRVCALLPPRAGITSGYVASGLSNGKIYGTDELPSDSATEAWLIMMHGASCNNKDGSKTEQKRADAFASMALTLIQGEGGFVSGRSTTQARLFSGYLNSTPAHWATNVGERVLLDLWKQETADILKQRSCRAYVEKSTNLNTDRINRNGSIGDEDCGDIYGGGQRPGKVSDENLWVWTSGRTRYDITMPPKPYTPFKPFFDIGAAVKYMWKTSSQLAQ